MLNPETKFYNNYLKTYLISKYQLPNIFLVPKIFDIKLNISVVFTWNDELILFYWFLFKKFNTTFSVKILGLLTTTNQKISVFEAKINWKFLKKLKMLNNVIEHKIKKKIGKTKTGFFSFSQYYYFNFSGQYKSNDLDYLLDRFDSPSPTLKFYILYNIKHISQKLKINTLSLVFNIKKLI